MDLYAFYTGNCFDAHKYLGAHKTDSGYIFRVFAPGAEKVSLLGDFNSFNEWNMERINDGNFFELNVSGASDGMRYFHRIYNKRGGYTDHCDVYGFGSELRPGYMSVLRDMASYSFNDTAWLENRSVCTGKPMNIYEVHLGSWMRKDGGSWYTYEEIADMLIKYVKDSGYNFIEFLPLCEHPCDESWGYQLTGFFCPTSRYGTAPQLKSLVDKCHQNGIGVIMDFVPAHFAVDSFGLHEYDGTSLYEYPHPDVGTSEWGSCSFMHSRGEVRSFLQSSAYYWLSEFHFDGLRTDAVSRIIYWQGDERRGVNGMGVEFLRNMNKGLKERIPCCILIAEDSTNYPNVTAPADNGGLGFDYKWDLGFMNDTLNYFRTAPEYRPENYHKLTFSMMYFYNEKYLLPFSHDENVHGKATILQKMHGQYDGKFPQARALYMYMYIHPGKKLNFMGGEFGQLREWDEHRAQDFELLEYPIHSGFHAFIKELNRLYLSHSAFYERDYDPSGFKWLDCGNVQNCIYAAERRSENEVIAAIFNFSASEKNYFVGEYGPRRAEVLLNSDWRRFGGSSDMCRSIDLGENILLPGYSGILIKPEL